MLDKHRLKVEKVVFGRFLYNQSTILCSPSRRCSMSLPSETSHSVPEETARVARAIFPKGNIYMRLYDALGSIYNQHDFVDLFSALGQPAIQPVRLALVCILQFMEGLTDQQASNAVRTRIDLKYLLGLELTDS